MRPYSGAGNAAAAVALTLFFSSALATAEEREWIIVPYLWGADTSLDARVNDDPVLGGDLEFSDLVDKLDFAFQLHVETRKSRFGLLFDLTYLDTSDSTTLAAGPPLPANAELETDADLTMFEVGGFYRPSGEQWGWDVLLGIRTMDVGAELVLTLPGSLGTRRFDGSSSLTDGFAGVRYTAALGDNWSLVLRGDAGTGDSDLSLNLVAMLGYRFGDWDRYNVLVGYRHFQLEFEESGGGLPIDIEMTMSGPEVGFALRF